VLYVVGPDSVSGCDRDATLTFRIDGQPALQTAINDLRPVRGGHQLDLTLQ
jgi:hypothetical protein